MAEAIQAGVRELLLCVGEDAEREGLRDTPKRVAKALLFALQGNAQSAAGALGTALFTERALTAPPPPDAAADAAALSGSEDSEDVFEVASAAAPGGLVVVRHIELFSTSQTDLQPFFGRCHVGYLPAAGRIVGLSKTARIAEVFARRLQTPQRLAEDIAAGLEEVAAPHGVAVLLETWTLAEAAALAAGPWRARRPARTCAATRGCFATERLWWDEFSALVGLEPGSAAPLAPPLAPLVALPPAAAAAEEEEGGEEAEGSPRRRAPGPQPACAACAARESAAAEAGAAAPRAVPPLAQPGLPADVEERMQAAVVRMLRGAGECPERDGLRGTALRYARTLLSSTQGGRQDLSAVLADALRRADDAAGAAPVSDAPDQGGIMEEHELPAVSMCEHHLLPFYGVAHVAYCRAPGAPRLPRAALQALVDHFARRLQVQERLTRQLAEGVAAATGAAGVMVVTEAAHMCMASRGVEKTASSTCSTATVGSFAADAAARAAFLASLRRARLAAAPGGAAGCGAAACGCSPPSRGAFALPGARTPPRTLDALAR